LLLYLQVLKRASEGIFVPLTVGGGIRSFTDANGTAYSALEVASEYFRCLLCSFLSRILSSTYSPACSLAGQGSCWRWLAQRSAAS
jgi:hypothetical protein